MNRSAKATGLVATALVTAMLAIVPAEAGTSLTLNGSFSTATPRKDVVFTSPFCPSGVADECGTMQLVGLGRADFTYVFGPTFDPDGRCFDVDGTFGLTLESDASTVSGPLTGLFCPDQSAAGHAHHTLKADGNPFSEDDTIALSGGTGQFNGLSSTVHFHQRAAGARWDGTLNGTLS
jgi:hypothetical protein